MPESPMAPLVAVSSLEPSLVEQIRASKCDLPTLGLLSNLPDDPHALLVSPRDAALTLVFILRGDSYRSCYHCWTSLDGRDEPATVEQDAVFIAAVAEILRLRAATERVWLGATHARWRPLLLDRGHDAYKLYDIWRSSGTLAERPRWRGIDETQWAVRPGDVRDCEEVARTSEIARGTEAYYPWLPKSSFLQPRPPPDTEDPWLPAVSWAFEHPDGSLGTLWTQPAYRGRGLGRAAMEHRWAAMDQSRAAFGYVGPDNAPSRGIFRSAGLRPQWQLFWTLLKR